MGRLSRDIATEREACQQQRGSGFAPCANHRQAIVDLADPFVPLPLRGADTSEVESHALPAELHKGPGQRLHHLVVHGAAMNGVGVADHGRAHDRAAGDIDGTLDFACRPAHCLAKRLGVHACAGTSAAHMAGQHQALNHLSVLQVRIDNFVNVMLVNVGVPNRIRVNHSHGPTGASIQTTRLVDTHTAFAMQFLGFHT